MRNVPLFLFILTFSKQVTMDKALYSFDSLEDIEDSRTDWKVRVKSQSIWKGINKKTGECKGYNIVFFDDYVSFQP